MSKQYLQTYTILDGHPTDVYSIAVTPTHLLTASGSSSIKIYAIQNQLIHNDSAEEENPYPLVQTLERVHPLGCHHISASLDGRIAASVGFDGEVKIWSCDPSSSSDTPWQPHGHIPTTPTSSPGDHWAPALTSTGDYLALSTSTGAVHVYDLTTLAPSNPVPTLFTTYATPSPFALSLDISPDGTLTASGHANGAIHVFDNATRRLVHTLSSGSGGGSGGGGSGTAIRTLRFSPASTLLACGGDGRAVTLWDARRGESVAVLAGRGTGHASWVLGVDWSRTGEWLASGAWDGRVKVWSVERRECVATLTGGEGKAAWGVRWVRGKEGVVERSERFVVGGPGGVSVYREASGT